MEDYNQSIQELILQKKSLESISDDELLDAFVSHMRKARHTEGNWIEFKFAKLAFQEMQNRESRNDLRKSWFMGFGSAIIGGLVIEIAKWAIK